MDRAHTKEGNPEILNGQNVEFLSINWIQSSTVPTVLPSFRETKGTIAGPKMVLNRLL